VAPTAAAAAGIDCPSETACTDFNLGKGGEITYMPYITVGEENSRDIEIYYKDWGSGQPIVFSHGWPLSADDWDTQMLFLLKHGIAS
jgi:hypothetical protein